MNAALLNKGLMNERKEFTTIRTNKNIVYVYTLKDSRDGTPFYVGKGRTKRIFEHLVQRTTSEAVYTKVQEILDAGADVLVDIYPVDHKKEDKAYALEKHLISFYGRADQGEGPLLNTSDGGSKGPVGHKQTAEHVRKRFANKRPSNSPESIAKQRATRNTPEYKAAQSERLRKVWAVRKAAKEQAAV